MQRESAQYLSGTDDEAEISDLRTNPSREGGDDDKRQPWPNADKKSGPQLLTRPKLLSFGPTLFKY